MTSTRAGTRPVQIAVCDSRKASLFRGHLEWPGRMRLSEVATCTSPWEGFHERRRPSALGQGPTANAAQHFAGLGHEQEEIERRFARDVAEFLREHARNGAGERLRGSPVAIAPEAVPATASSTIHVFAAPRFLGHLRDALGPLGDGLELFRGEFAGLRASEIAAHPTIRAILGATPAAFAEGVGRPVSRHASPEPGGAS